MIRIREIAELTPKALHALRRIIDKRFAEDSSDDVIPDAAVPANLDRYSPGNIYGAHKERIIRREVRRQCTPPWFDPITNPGHFGIITNDGYRCYIEVDVNVAARNLPSTFDTRIRAFVEDDPDQMALF